VLPLEQLNVITRDNGVGKSNLYSEKGVTPLNLGRVRTAIQSDMALGNDKFKEEIETLTGRRISPIKRGRRA
jgi:hypothetical protein